MCDPETTEAYRGVYCCTKPNWIGSSRLWNNRPRPHSLGLLAYIIKYLRHGKNSQEDIFAGRYFREKIFSREVIFAGRYFRGKIFSREQYSRKYLLAKIFQIDFSRKFLPAKIKCYTVHEP